MDILIHFGAPQAGAPGTAQIAATAATSEGHQIGMTATVNFSLSDAAMLTNVKAQVRAAVEGVIGRTITTADKVFLIGSLSRF